MNSLLKVWVALIAVAIIAVGGYFYPIVKQTLGEIGTRYPNGIYIGPVSSPVFTLLGAGAPVYSSTNATSTSATSQTLALSDIQNYDTVIVNPTVGNDTLTFFASSTATTWLPNAGNQQNICFVNGTTTAGVYLTFAGGTGTTLLVASSSATVLGSKQIGPQKMGCFDFIRGNATATTFDILGAFTAYQ